MSQALILSLEEQRIGLINATKTCHHHKQSTVGPAIIHEEIGKNQQF